MCEFYNMRFETETREDVKTIIEVLKEKFEIKDDVYRTYGHRNGKGFYTYLRVCIRR